MKICFPAAIAATVVGFTGAALSLGEVRPLLIAAIFFQVAAGAWTPLASQFFIFSVFCNLQRLCVSPEIYSDVNE